MELTCTFSFRRMILLLMLFWNMLWELLGVRMVCPPSIYPPIALSFCPPKTPSFDFFRPMKPMPYVACTQGGLPRAVGGWAFGYSSLWSTDPPPHKPPLPVRDSPLSFCRAPLTPLTKRPLAFQSALSLRSKLLTPSHRSRPHRMRRSNSILRPTPTLGIRLYTPRFTPYAILGSINSIPTYFARGE